jgi:DUF4097 and DUF4098 domain-containing protein YvlB
MDKKIACAALALALLAASAAAQKRIDEKRPAEAGVLLRISNTAGSVKVSGWDRDEIGLSGVLGSNVDRVDFSSEGGLATISVVIKRNSWSSRGTDLEVSVPSGSALDVETVSADVEVKDVKGKMRLATVSGSIRATGGPAAFIATSTSGSIVIYAEGSGGRAQSISGDIGIRNPGGDVHAVTVSGDISLKGGRIDSASLETTSGRIRLDTDLTKGAQVDAKSMSGPIELTFSAEVSAAFDLSTFSGKIENGLKPDAGESSDILIKSLSLSTGNDARVVAESFSGKLSLKRR